MAEDYSNYIKEIILETKKRLNDFISSNVLNRLLGFDYDQLRRITIELNKIEESIIQVIKKRYLNFLKIRKK